MVTPQGPGHPNLIYFIDYYQEPGAGKWLVLEYMKGDWLNNVVARNHLEEGHVARIAAEVCVWVTSDHYLKFTPTCSTF